MKRYLHFEEPLPYFQIKGSFELLEYGPNGSTPVVHIRTDQDWRGRFNWETQSPLNYVMCGNWVLNLYLEQLGIKEFHLPKANKQVKFVAKPYSYCAEIVIPAGTVPAGVYELAATLTLEGPTGIPAPIAGVAKINTLQFYEGGPIGLPVTPAQADAEMIR